MVDSAVKKSAIQLYTLSGMSSWAIFAIRVDCPTVSNALLKSNAITYGFMRSILVIVLRMEISAAVVEPVGQKANWSVNDSIEGGERRSGYRNR